MPRIIIMLSYIVSFLILLNPFALFVYVLPILKEQGVGKFSSVMLRASLISGGIYIFFALSGQAIFNALGINFEAFRIFGGVVLVSFALSFILQGKQSMITTRGELSKIAAEIALPFIVGAGTITLSIIMGEALKPSVAFIAIVIVMILNYLIIIWLGILRQSLTHKLKTVFDKNSEILLRINGFIVGAYGVNLIFEGLNVLL